jgi:hypothetical protein
VVRDRDREPEQSALSERRLRDEHVRRVARAVERVVDEVDVARRELVAEVLEERLHRVRDRAELERDRDRLRDRLAVGPQSAAEKSIASRTTAECAVRNTVVAISSAAVSSAFATSRRAIGAACCSLSGQVRGLTLQEEGARRLVERDRPAGRDDDRRVVLVDEERARGGLAAERRARAHGHVERLARRSTRRVRGRGLVAGRAVEREARRSGPRATRRSARTSTGEPGSSRVP